MSLASWSALHGCPCTLGCHRCILFNGEHLNDINQLCDLPVNPVCRVEHTFDFPNPLALWQYHREIPLAV